MPSNLPIWSLVCLDRSTVFVRGRRPNKNDMLVLALFAPPLSFGIYGDWKRSEWGTLTLFCCGLTIALRPEVNAESGDGVAVSSFNRLSSYGGSRIVRALCSGVNVLDLGNLEALLPGPLVRLHSNHTKHRQECCSIESTTKHVRSNRRWDIVLELWMIPHKRPFRIYQDLVLAMASGSL